MYNKSVARYRESDGVTSKTWYIERIWTLAETLPAEMVQIEDIRGPQEVTWFSENSPPTCLAVVGYCKRILTADLNYPVILTEDFRVFDGMHRIARCILDGKTHICAKRFLQNPEPDEIASI